MKHQAAGLLGVPLLLLAMTVPAMGQEPSRPAVLPLDSLAWISGRWLSCDGGTRHEGIWLEPSAGSMAGVFRTGEGAKTVRYELFLIEQSNGGPLLSRLVYGPSLSPGEQGEQWEGLRLRDVHGMRARFSPSADTPSLSVVIERTPEDRLRISVEHAHAGKRTTHAIEYSRQQP